MRPRIQIAVAVAATMLATAACVATAQVGTDPVPDLMLSTAWFPSYLPQAPVLLVVPDGTGPSFEEARLINGQTVNRKITLWALDGGGFPIPNMPYAAWSLRWQDGGVAACENGLAATFNTRANGSTDWIAPPHAGGHSQSLVRVYWQASQPLLSNTGMLLSVNSPDINGDISVDIADVADFAADYFGAYAFRSDLAFDGAVNLTDISVLLSKMGRSCP